jgi:hypothetical protein
MAKITITRLPNATPDYEPSQFDQMVRLLEQLILNLNTSYSQDIENKSSGRSWYFGWYI